MTGFSPCVLRAARSSALIDLSSPSTACTFALRAILSENVPEPANRSITRLALPRWFITSSAIASSAGLVAWVKAPGGGDTLTPPKSMIGFVGSRMISPFTETRAMPFSESTASVTARRCLSSSFFSPSAARSSPDSVSSTVRWKLSDP
ncbi:hypothetical protein D3C87_1419120 [compost metagenome]